MDVVEQIFLDMIKDYTPKDLEKAIKENVNLSALVKQYMPYMVNTARVFAPLFSSQKGNLNVENMLYYMKCKRPELVRVIILNKKGIKWMETNIKDIKALLW